MRYTKLARMAIVPGVALTMLATPGISEAAAPAAPAAHTALVKRADAPTATTASVRRLSKRCARPRNQRLNVSYSPGRASTTFYFNNHCRHKGYIRIKVHVLGTGNVIKCIRVNARTHGRKKIWHAGGSINSVKLARC